MPVPYASIIFSLYIMLASFLFLSDDTSTGEADGKATKFISDVMQKLTLTVRKRGIEGIELIISNFNRLNTSILRAFGVIPEEI